MVHYAKTDLNGRVLQVFSLSQPQDAIHQPLADDEQMVQLSDAEYEKWEKRRKGSVVNAVFIPDDPEPEPPPPTLDELKDEKVRQLERDTRWFIEIGPKGKRYTQEKQSSFNAFFLLSLQQTMGTNVKDKTKAEGKMAKLQTVFDWISSVLDYHYQKDSEIRSAATAEEVEAVTWDFSPFEDTDPKITLKSIKG